jgi:hypothetical protein
MESRNLLLENTFAVKEVFSNNEATSWAVEELKRRGLKRLFKPVASTAYERLVREFYTHLRIDDDQPDSLFSSIDGKNVEVTIGDIAAVLKCSHEPPESDIPWIECPSMLTLEDIVSDMCEGQYADDRWNAASKTKIPRNLLFTSSGVLQPFEFGLPTRCSTKVPNEPLACLEAEVRHPGLRGPMLV